ncbi:MAG TPA: DUF1634 domain-containing protein [Planctomycetaceae bacterium]|nr:DUF1634 domain-containing protein [Planctomycetaceae bacterium]
MSWTLLLGLSASATLIVLGWLLSLRQVPSDNAGDTGLLTRAVHGDATSLLECGLIVLMLTPVARVLILAVGWALRRDWTFSLIAFWVLALLALSVVLGTG